MNPVQHTFFACAVFLFYLIFLNAFKHVFFSLSLKYYLVSEKHRSFQSDISLPAVGSPGGSPLGAHLPSCSTPCCFPAPKVPMGISLNNAEALLDAIGYAQKLNNQ